MDIKNSTRALAIISLSSLLLVSPRPAFAKPKYEVINNMKSEFWSKIETLRLKNSKISREIILDISKRKGTEIIEAFGRTDKPKTSDFLLHQLDALEDKNPDSKSQERKFPILLVHGAMVDANISWADGCYHRDGETGLATRLKKAGYRVFAVTFAHAHGDNDTQAEQVAACIDRIKKLCKCKKVDVIAHSKGTMSARMYCASVRAELKKFTKYQKDVARLILIGGPQKGIDINFAFPNLNYMIIAENLNAPVVWTTAMVYGVWKKFDKMLFYKPCRAFIGQAQMLARFDKEYGLIDLQGQYDVETTYQGGKGQVTVSLGIDKAIADGGHLIARLAKAGVDKRIKVALLAGTHCRITGYFGERRGPSDGVVLVRSALYKAGVDARGAKILRRSALPLNHLELTYKPRAVRWILRALER